MDERSGELQASFLATRYRVTTPAGIFDLRICLFDAAFDAFLHAQRVRDWAIVTACNPGGRLTLADNDRRMRQFASQVADAGFVGYPSVNIADDGRWPDEPGLCIVNAGQEAITRLARAFGQVAVVYGDRTNDGKAGGELLWLA